MACRFHRLKEYIIDKVNSIVKRDINTSIINYYNIHELRLDLVFTEAYMKFYGKEEYKYLFVVAGDMCEEHIKICVALLNKHDTVNYVTLNPIIFQFINRQFEIYADKFIFGCMCGCPISVKCEGDGNCFPGECNGDLLDNVDCKCSEGCSLGCKLQECTNFSVCKNKIPKWVNDINNGICFDCKHSHGKMVFTNQITECSICNEEITVVEIFCGHKMCFGCWDKVVKGTPVTHHLETNDNSPACPFCRRFVWEP
jgi:Zinc finger, C3HC4 type (RING finger)